MRSLYLSEPALCEYPVRRIPETVLYSGTAVMLCALLALCINPERFCASSFSPWWQLLCGAAIVTLAILGERTFYLHKWKAAFLRNNADLQLSWAAIMYTLRHLRIYRYSDFRGVSLHEVARAVALMARSTSNLRTPFTEEVDRLYRSFAAECGTAAVAQQTT